MSVRVTHHRMSPGGCIDRRALRYERSFLGAGK